MNIKGRGSRRKKKAPELLEFKDLQTSFYYFRGAGGNRTLVQTGKPYAFYTLIPAFGFRAQTRPEPPIYALSFKISPSVQGHGRLSPI